MSGRGLRAAGVASGALLVLAACSVGTQAEGPAAAPALSVSAPPPVGSIEHPRPADCIDGITSPPAGTVSPAVPRPTAGGADVVVGPVTWKGLRAAADAEQTTYGTRNSDGWHYRVALDIRPGAVVTVTIGAQQRARAGLEYGGGYGTTPAPAVTFHSCPGSVTTFPGGFFVAGDGRVCVPLDIRTGDGSARHIVISFFKGACPSA